MFKIFKYYLLRTFFSWLLVFVFFKSLFITFHWEYIKNEKLFEILNLFFKSLKIDISSISYILIIPFLLSIVQFFTTSRKIKNISKNYNLLILFFISIINVVDITLYGYWGSKISLKSFLFLSTPRQIFASIGFNEALMVIFFILFHFFLAKSIFKKAFYEKSLRFTKSAFSFVFFICLIASMLIIGLRGGLQVVPINQSDTYYSKNNTLNIAGINPLWNFVNTLVQNGTYVNTNPYIKMENIEAKKLVENLYLVEKDTTIMLFNLEKPNIVYIALEGVNANVFNAFSKKESYAPNIEKLFKEGYLFKEMYASGFRSDQGMVSILSGFPPTPVSSICAQPEKFTKLPNMPKELQKHAYDCSFYFGGEASFGNFKSFLVYSGFDPLIEVDDYKKSERTQNLGVPDEFVFEKFNKEMVNQKEPFFSLIFTQTTHEPYDMPFNKGVKDERLKYINTVLYVDSVIGKWYNDVKNMPWYDNTVFILSSDHSHAYPGNYVGWEASRYHIPFLIFGKPLKEEFIGTMNHDVYSQVDIPKSILAQLKIKNSNFKWSKNFMNPYTNKFAFYSFVEAYCLKTEDNLCGWEYNWEKPFGDCDSTFYQKQGQAFLQELYNDYLEY